MPCRHCPAASSHDAMWNAMSWPEAVPKKKKGLTTKSATRKERAAAVAHSRKAEAGSGRAPELGKAFMGSARIVTGRPAASTLQPGFQADSRVLAPDK